MIRPIALVLSIATLCLLSATVGAEEHPKGAVSQDEAAFFELKIRPVLMQTCFKCHGGDKVSNELRLDAREHLLQGGLEGPALVPGNAEESLLISALRHDHPQLQMPPSGPLGKAVVADFERWVNRGAVWPDHSQATAMDQSAGRHWAFQPIRPVDPSAEDGGWSQHPIDRLIHAKHRELGLAPIGQANKYALIRRAYFDLIGLPPTAEQVASFVADDRPDAFAHVVDDLLSSPHYGERWGRHWLDLVRYADTAGDNSDYPIREAYLYRDWVIRAFNDDKPYDQFLHEQLAGDILALSSPSEQYADLVTATGFVAQAKRFGTHKLENMHLIVEDTLTTVSEVTLGMTFKCARCHDHKFDPTTMEDYYALYGIFQGTAYPFAGSEEARRPEDFVPLIPPDQLATLQAERAEKAARLKAQIQQHEENTSPLAGRPEQLAEELESLQRELQAHENQRIEEWVPVAYAVTEGKEPGDVPIQIDGNPRQPGEIAPRGVPQFLTPDFEVEIPPGSSGRLQLAHWLTSPKNPLTARVMANRIWQYHFGKGLVATPNDFGMQTPPPTHPELLDWLATQFIESGWSIKKMHRLIMLSKTYQLSSAVDTANEQMDGGNAYYWRFDRRRLEAESIRDSMLLIAGNLDLRPAGRHPFPDVNTWGYSAHRQFNDVCYPSPHRSVYLMVQRLHPHPYLSLFNGPDAGVSTPVRDDSTLPLQALFAINSEFATEQARGLAQRVISEASPPRDRIRIAHELAYSRPPSQSEYDKAEAYLAQYQQLLLEEGITGQQNELDAWTSYARILLASNEFIYVN